LEFLHIIFFTVIGVQVIYFLTYIIALSKTLPEKPRQALPVSIIICAHDEEKNLKELIPMLLSQNHPEFEIVIVDDRSNDGTFDFLLQETSKDHRLRMVHVNRTPQIFNAKKYALTLGIKAAKYEWLLLTDADCRPNSKDWISSFARHFSETTQFVLGFSPYEKHPGILNSFIRFETLVSGMQYISFALLGIPYMGVGRNLSYRRSKFLEAKGFNNFTKVTGGDDDLFVNQHATKKNTAVCISEDSIVTSIPKTTFKSYYTQKVRHLSVGRHPGRCAELRVGDWPVGHAGELHPKVVEALGLPKRTVAMELDLDALPLSDNRPAPVVSAYPPVLLDVAVVVPADVPAERVARALRGGGGALLEDIRLFDVYTGDQVGEGKRSLAYSLRFRAPDRTLTVEEATAARDAAVAAAAERFGAALRA
jgi:hypothetical protein